MVDQNFTLLLAPLVNYSRHSVSESLRYVWKSINRYYQREMSSISEFFRMFEYSLRLEWLTYLDAKGAKRSIEMWIKYFYKSVFKIILLCMNSWLSKNRSVHSYVMPRTIYLDWICTFDIYNIYRICNAD